MTTGREFVTILQFSVMATQTVNVEYWLIWSNTWWCQCLLVCRESNYIGNSPVRTDRGSYSNAASPRRFPPFSLTTALGVSPHSEPLRVADVPYYSGSCCSVSARTFSAHRHQQRHPSPSLNVAASHRPCITAVGFPGTFTSSPVKINRTYQFC